MARKLLVRTPRTKDGVNLVYDADKQAVYTESYLELAARKGLESLNAKLPEHLRHEIKEVEVEDAAAGAPVSTNEQLRKRLAELELETENEQLRKRIAELEAGKGGPDSTATPLRTAADVVKDIQAAETVEAVNALAEGDERKTVATAAEKRISELEAGK